MLPPYAAIIRHPLGGRSRVFYWNVAQKTKYRQKWKRKDENGTAKHPKGISLSQKIDLLDIVVAVVGVVAVFFHHDGKAHGVYLGVLAGGQRLHDDMFGAVDDDLRSLHLAHPLVVQDAAMANPRFPK